MTFDKRAYQRELMRKRRAAAKAEAEGPPAEGPDACPLDDAWQARLCLGDRLDYRAALRRALTPPRRPFDVTPRIAALARV